ncbi:MAG: type II toxin-antitoxin system RelE/ParE family toxin [Firmicutes bacterium]|nr:type II toxin-antitoxin system RelE/ParE family toxin [[Eubacterium] siraeum]MCM1487962.1 type II toxin-antitoxin system RelE/ParE family toxin [Bacillota bacterium]
MNYKVLLTPTAGDDLRSIFKYIAYTLQSVQTAEGQLNRLQKAINSLEYMPERFRVYDKEPWKSHNFHIMNVDNYQIFYAPDIKKQTVTVFRIIYGKRDVQAQLYQIDL